MTSRHPAVSCACPKCQSERRTTPTPAPAAGEREAVAREVNPDVWASFDGSIRPYAENRGANASTDSAHFYERTWRAGCRTPDDVRRWWLETADAAKESTYVLLLRDSLTKAEAALSALAPIRAAEILAAEASERAALDWLTAHRNVEISHYSPVYADEDDDAVEWRVTRVSGGVNDREWTIIGRGQTARAALMDAIEHGAGK